MASMAGLGQSEAQSQQVSYKDLSHLLLPFQIISRKLDWKWHSLDPDLCPFGMLCSGCETEPPNGVQTRGKSLSRGQKQSHVHFPRISRLTSTQGVLVCCESVIRSARKEVAVQVQARDNCGLDQGNSHRLSDQVRGTVRKESRKNLLHVRGKRIEDNLNFPA